MTKVDLGLVRQRSYLRKDTKLKIVHSAEKHIFLS